MLGKTERTLHHMLPYSLREFPGLSIEGLYQFAASVPAGLTNELTEIDDQKQGTILVLTGDPYETIAVEILESCCNLAQVDVVNTRVLSPRARYYQHFFNLDNLSSIYRQLQYDHVSQDLEEAYDLEIVDRISPFIHNQWEMLSRIYPSLKQNSSLYINNLVLPSRQQQEVLDFFSKQNIVSKLASSSTPSWLIKNGLSVYGMKLNKTNSEVKFPTIKEFDLYNQDNSPVRLFLPQFN